MQNLIELEYVIDFLKQEPCIDMDLHEAYFSCPFCEKDYLDVFKKIFKKKYLKYIIESEIDYGMLCFNFKTRDFRCVSLNGTPFGTVHALAFEMVIQEKYIPELTYSEYIVLKRQMKKENSL